jgi:adenosylcobinamide kinase / adenosylcobinamide-phosphate guanylyltransferase
LGDDMGIVLVTGGARSGKSSYAESLYKDFNNVVYIATSKIYDDEMKERIKLHRSSRPSQWRTFEGNYNLCNCIGEEKKYLLDCITVLTSNIMFDITENMEKIPFEIQKKVEDTVINEVGSLINEIKNKKFNLIMVTNEVGSSIVPENHIARIYRDIAGRINQKIASLSDEVYLVTCGIPLRIK